MLVRTGSPRVTREGALRGAFLHQSHFRGVLKGDSRGCSEEGPRSLIHTSRGRRGVMRRGGRWRDHDE